MATHDPDFALCAPLPHRRPTLSVESDTKAASSGRPLAAPTAATAARTAAGTAATELFI